MTSYLPSKQYQYAGVAAVAIAFVCAAFAVHWPLAWVPAALFLVSGALLVALGCLPAVEVHDSHLAIGSRIIGWEEIRALDRTGFVSPMVIYLTLAGNRRVLVVYAGGLDASNALLRHLQKMCREALLDGIPHRQFWGEALPPAPERKSLPSPRYQLLRPEDEAEVERMFQRLKSVGRFDRSEEK